MFSPCGFGVWVFNRNFSFPQSKSMLYKLFGDSKNALGVQLRVTVWCSNTLPTCSRLAPANVTPKESEKVPQIDEGI